MSGELERFDPFVQRGRIAYEHYHRYAICRDCVAGKRVLDLACGTGYGAALLAGIAAQVIGVDISSEAIREAKSRFKARNLKFQIADCYDLPFEDCSFDVVVANEMIEHVQDHDGVIKEAKRVLADGGLFLVSTPNKPIYNRYKSPNDFHVSEMDLSDFRKSLQRHFPHVELIGLRMALLSVGFDLENRAGRSNSPSAQVYSAKFEGGRPVIENTEMSFGDPEYLQAICSAAPVDALPHRASLFYSRDDDLWLEHERIMDWASQLHEEDEVLRADLRRAQSEAAVRQASAEASEQQIGSLNRAIEALRLGLEQQQASAQNAGGQLPVMARILSRMTKSDVASDAVATVDALFSLNSQMVEQQARIAALENVEARAGAAEAELKDTRVGLADAAAKSETLANALETARENLSSFQDRLAESEAMQVALRARMDEADRRVADTVLERDEAIAGWSDARSQLTLIRERAQRDAESLKQELEARTRRVEELESQLHRPVAKVAEEGFSARSQQGTDIDARSLDRFTAIHRRVRAQLADAPRNIADRKPAPRSSRKRGLLGRLTNGTLTPNTAIFDTEWIAGQSPGSGKVSLSRFLRDAHFRGISPHPLFDAGEYLRVNCDVATTQLNPLLHYIDHGWREGRNPHRYFHNDWYLSQNPDVLAAGWTNPLDHYLKFGWREGRWPNPVFDPQAYLDKYPDVAQAGVEPLSHYIAHGQHEGREVPVSGISAEWQRLLRPENREVCLLDHLLGTDPLQARPIAKVVEAPQAWPPPPLNDYWLPQTLRNYLIDGWGDEHVDLYWYLCSVMEFYRDRPDEFPGSKDCQLIVERLRQLTQLRRQNQAGVPDATIIVPVYNNVLDTMLCLVTVLETSDSRAFEIIVADDGSSDATQQLVTQIGGVVAHIRQPENLGFLGNCNAAAKVAKGRCIVLLNNDTLVLPNWLEQLLRPFERIENVGLVGSKLINWDGTLQEAGGIFWQDGSAWNFGRGQDARDPVFNYLKDVDYCSGASIAVPTKLWKELGGFDPLFSPAYCEDSDLAFRIRKEGLRTLYSPHSEVIHHEGRSHGRDLASGVKAYQVINQAKLVDRWGDQLRDEHFPNAQNVLRARDRSRSRRHVLVIDHYVPQWDQDAGSRTIYQYIETFLKLGCRVTFWPDNLWRDPDYTPALQEMGVEVMYGPKLRDGFDKFIRDRSDLYDAVLVSRPHVARNYMRLLKEHSSARILYYGHDLHFRRMEASRQLGNPVATADITQMQSLELEVCRGSDVIFYPDPDEVAWVKSEVGGKRKFIPNPVFIYDDERISGARSNAQAIIGKLSRKLLFVGGFNHSPNREGIVWFVRNVWPLIEARMPGTTLDIVGSRPPVDVLDLASETVSVHGFVSDERLGQLYGDAAAAIAPLRYGAGVKGKVIEAMAYGVPVITTDVGAQGIPDPQSLLFVGSSAEEFAEAACLALDNRQEASGRAAQAVDFIASHYSKPALEKIFDKLLSKKK